MPDKIRNPHNLPAKICPVCKRAFTWRKKWERDWDTVRYCSERCRHQSTNLDGNPNASAPRPASND